MSVMGILLCLQLGADLAPDLVPDLGESPAFVDPPDVEMEFLSTVGAPGRLVEVDLGTGIDALGVVAQRLEIAAAVPLRPNLLGVLRLEQGADTGQNTTAYAVRTPSLTLGLRNQTQAGGYWIEGGLRALLPSFGPFTQGDNGYQRLSHALEAAQVMGSTDDALWLPLSTLGVGAYFGSASRSTPWRPCCGWSLDWMFEYGGQLSVGTLTTNPFGVSPLEVRSALGPQTGLIANLYTEFSAAVGEGWGLPLQVSVGVHGGASLSSIWPGQETLPVDGEIFAGWAPAFMPGIALRIARGWALLPLEGGSAVGHWTLQLRVDSPAPWG
jgi:hypothetical protein